MPVVLILWIYSYTQLLLEKTILLYTRGTVLRIFRTGDAVFFYFIILFQIKIQYLEYELYHMNYIQTLVFIFGCAMYSSVMHMCGHYVTYFNMDMDKRVIPAIQHIRIEFSKA